LGTKSLRPLTSKDKPNAVARVMFPEKRTASRSSDRMCFTAPEKIFFKTRQRAERFDRIRSIENGAVSVAAPNPLRDEALPSCVFSRDPECHGFT